MSMFAVAGCSIQPGLTDEPSVTSEEWAAIEAFSGENSMYPSDERMATSTTELADWSDVVVRGVVTETSDGRAYGDAHSVFVGVEGEDADGAEFTGTVEVWAADSTPVEEAVAAVPVGADVIAYLVAATDVAPDGGEIVPGAEDLFAPVNRQGFILVDISERAPNDELDHLVWPLAGMTSAAVNGGADALPGGSQLGG